MKLKYFIQAIGLFFPYIAGAVIAHGLQHWAKIPYDSLLFVPSIIVFIPLVIWVANKLNRFGE